MVKILGYKHKNGTFTNDRNESVDYDNYSFYFLTDEDEKVKGYSTELRGVRVISVPVKKIREISGYDNPDALIGRMFRPRYDLAYGRARLVALEEVKDK